jgi:hypothetical protein
MGSNPIVSAILLISRQFAALMAPMGRADRAAPGRACEPCGFEMAPLCSAISKSPLFIPSNILNKKDIFGV